MKQTKPITNWDSVPIILDIPYVAWILGRSDNSIRDKAKAGLLPFFKVGGEWRIKKDDLLNWIEAQKQSA